MQGNISLVSIVEARRRQRKVGRSMMVLLMGALFLAGVHEAYFSKPLQSPRSHQQAYR